MIQDTSVDKWGWLYALLFVVIAIIVVIVLTKNNVTKQVYVPKQEQPIIDFPDDGRTYSICYCPNQQSGFEPIYYEDRTGKTFNELDITSTEPAYTIQGQSNYTVKITDFTNGMTANVVYDNGLNYPVPGSFSWGDIINSSSLGISNFKSSIILQAGNNGVCIDKCT